MTDSAPHTSGQGSLWVQSAPGVLPRYLGCHQMGDVTAPEGDVTLLFCPDPARNDGFKVSGSFQGQPGAITFDIVTPLAAVRDYLLNNCPQNIFVNKFRGSGRRDVFENREYGAVLTGVRRTSRTLGNLVARTPDAKAESLQTISFAAERLVEFYKLGLTRLTTSETAELRAVAFCGEEQCETDELVATSRCQFGIAVGKALVAASPPDRAAILFTEDGGGTWTPAAANPFAGAEDVAAVACVAYGGGTRYIVARGTTDGANPMEIAYSDDGGATWVNVNVGSVVGQYAVGQHALWAVDAYSIWLVTSGGYIYRSQNAGAAWEALEEGVITSDDYLAVHAANRNTIWVAGEGDVIVRTTDGDATAPTFSEVTATGGGDNITSLDVRSQNRAWAGTAGGESYLTIDGGVTWEAKFTAGTGTVRAVRFSPDGMGGFLLHNSGSTGLVYQTINGGATWERLTTPSNGGGLNSIWVCDEANAFVVGAAQSGYSFILRIAPALA